MKRSGFSPLTKEKLAKLAEKKRERQIAKAKLPKPLKTAPVASQTSRKVKTKTQAQLKKELDAIFSLYIRTKFSDSEGNNHCYTCGKPGTVKTMHCGHYVSRQYLATRWCESNTRIQCAGCNLFGNGKPLDFEERLKKELGEEYVENMKASRHQMLKLDRNWYKEQIELYKNKLEQYV